MVPHWLRVRLRPIVLELLEGGDVVGVPPCLFEADHEFDPWQLTLLDCAGTPVLLQQRRCIVCGFAEQAPIHDPTRPVLVKA